MLPLLCEVREDIEMNVGNLSLGIFINSTVPYIFSVLGQRAFFWMLDP